VAKHLSPWYSLSEHPTLDREKPGKHRHSGWAIMKGVVVGGDVVMVRVLKYMSHGHYLIKGMNQVEYVIAGSQLTEVQPRAVVRFY
jgi:hypothetical protein